MRMEGAVSIPTSTAPVPVGGVETAVTRVCLLHVHMNISSDNLHTGISPVKVDLKIAIPSFLYHLAGLHHLLLLVHEKEEAFRKQVCVLYTAAVCMPSYIIPAEWN